MRRLDSKEVGRQKQRIAVAVCCVVVLCCCPGMAGPLDSPAAPTDPGSAMYTLEDLYNRLDTGAAGTQSVFTEPSAGPGSTGHTLNEVMSKAPVVKATAAVAGDVLKGKAYWGLKAGAWGTNTGTRALAPAPPTPASWPNPRFTNNGNGTVTDNLTLLVWLRNANAFGARIWTDASSDCATLSTGEYGLTDGSADGDWRLPSLPELLSVLDYRYYDPPVCNTAGTGQWSSGNPFINVRSLPYWTSTRYTLGSGNAWYVEMFNGSLLANSASGANPIWSVRGGL